ncbi:MAG: hypothetical protein QXE81_01355 [Desulfurococcaceae archaeon]
MEITWSRVLSHSSYKDCVFSLCVSTDRLFVVGSDEHHGPGKMRYRAMAIRAIDGSDISTWVDDKTYPFASLLTCTSYGDIIYALGATNEFWSILVFNRNLELLRRVDIDNPRIIPFSTFTLYKYTDLYLYVAGTSVSADGSTNAYVAKISAMSLAIVGSASITADSISSGACAIGFNNATKQVVIGGFVKTDKGLEWLITFLNEDLKPLKIVKPGIPGSITSISIDPSGYIYAIDYKTLARITPDGRVESTIPLPSPSKIYTTQDKASPLAPYVIVVTENNIRVFSRTDLSEITTIRLFKEPHLIMPYPGSMDSVGDSLYVGLTRAESDTKYSWFILRLAPRSRRFTLFGR